MVVNRINRREDLELMKYFDWISWQEKLDTKLAVIYHTPNEGTRSIRRGKIMKQKGVRAGIPDICCPIPSGQYHGLYIELKIKPNKLSDKQVDMCKLLHGLGHCVRVAWSGDEAIKITKEYLNL